MSSSPLSFSLFLPYLPEMLFALGAVVLFVEDLFLPNKKEVRLEVFFWTLFLIVVATGYSLFLIPFSPSLPYGLVDDLFRRVLIGIFLVLFFLTLLLSHPYLKHFPLPEGEYYLLLLFSFLGLSFLVSTQHLGYIFLALELLSLPLYSLCSLRYDEPRSGEGGMKYFFLGSSATTFLLMGTALIYLDQGSFLLQELQDGKSPIFFLGIFLFLLGSVFKLSWVPLHFWSPDAYEGAPLPVTAWMSTGVKVGVVGVLLRFTLVLSSPYIRTFLIVGILFTVIYGNLLTLRQENLKRFFAYSSIAHAGYLGLGFVEPNLSSIASILFYLVVYSLMNMGGFGVLVALSEKGKERENLGDFKGLSHTHPFLSFVFLSVLVSFAGIPPLAGFSAKVFLFSSALSQGVILTTLVAILFSVLSLYYYVRPVVAMYMEEGGGKNPPIPLELSSHLMVLFVGVLSLLFFLGVWPGILFRPFEMVGQSLVGGGLSP